MSVIFLNNFLLIAFLVLLPYCLQINYKHDLPKMYFGILIEDNQNFSDIFIRNTLYNYIETNMPFQDPYRYETLHISLSDYRNFSGSFLKHFCELVERKIIIAILIFGDTSTTIFTNFFAKILQVPVLWARNSYSSFYTHSFFTDKHSLEVHYLEPTAYELMKALRNLFIQTHWYTFKLLTDDSTISSSLLIKDIWSILNSEPLNPTKISLSNHSLSQSLYRTLNQIATSTRGILVLMCDYMMAKKVLSEAETLNMTNKNFIWIWIETKLSRNKSSFNEFPIGVLQIKPMKMQMTQKFIDNSLRVVIESLNNLFIDHPEFQLSAVLNDFEINCWENSSRNSRRDEKKTWKKIGQITSNKTQLNTIVWPGGNIVSSSAPGRIHKAFRIVTALAPPFVMEGNPDQDGQCLRGLICYRLRNNLTNTTNNYNDNQIFSSDKFQKNCCYGLSIDLLDNIAKELEFQFFLYIVADGLFGSRVYTKQKRFIHLSTNRPILSFRHDSVFKTNYDFKINFNFSNNNNNYRQSINDFDTNVMWNGVVGDLISGAAHMSFTALSVTSIRSHVIDFSIPYYYGGMSFLASPKQKSGIPLMAFLLPFSTELWIAIFTSLNITAVAVAVYEWLSPFGLNPWGRQRSKNFSLSSALWVMWGLLCGHLVAFKAPKSWPNKFLINVWGGFSVIFIASYTANIAALIAGSFFHNTVGDYHDQSLLNQKIGSPKSSSAEWYVQNANGILWEHMKYFRLENIQEGIDRLKNGSLDIVLTDKPILDYYQATDHGCKLKKIGDTIFEDTYAIGMTKGFHLKDSISSIIAKYSSNGYMDILKEKWFGGLPCFKTDTEMTQPRPLGIAAVTGVFILLLFGMVLGTVILISEHLFYKFSLPKLRHKPKDSIWRSRNIMFFSQKLYRFINCVELVSPHHAAKELISTLRQGQITSLFQKSVKRKEHEQTRRRRSKAQFFEMIQTIRRQQQEEKRRPLESVNETCTENEHSTRRKSHHSPNLLHKRFIRPKQTIDRNQLEENSKHKTKIKSIQNLRRFSTEINIFSPLSVLNLGRRFNRDNKSEGQNTLALKNCPSPANSIDIAFLNREKKSPVLSIENLSLAEEATDFKSYMKQENIGKKLAMSPLNTQKAFILPENVPQYPTIQISVHEEQDSNNNINNNNLMLSLFEKLSSNELEVMLNANDLQLREMILKAFQMKFSHNQT